MRAALTGSDLWRWLASHLALPLRRRHGDRAVVVVVATRLFTDEVLDLSAVLGLPVERWRLQGHTAVCHHVFSSKQNNSKLNLQTDTISIGIIKK